MNTPPERAIEAFLADVHRRVRARDAARATLIAAALLLASLLVAWLAGARATVGIVAAVIAAAVGFAGWIVVRASTWREPMLLPLVEARQPSFRNLLVTARELTQHPDRTRLAIRDRVLHDAARIAGETSLDAIVPARETTRAFRAAATVLLLAVIVGYASTRWPRTADDGATPTDARTHGSTTSGASSTATTGIRTVTAIVTPPSYTGRPAVTLRDPARIDAIAGSHLRIDIEGASSARLAFNDRAHTLTSVGDTARGNDAHRFRSELTLTESGVVTIASTARDADPARLIAINVTPDQPPTVELVTPGKDLLFDDAGARVEFVARARDDLGMRALALRYTKVSGSGERYEFHEGELPLAIARTDAQQWQGQLARSIRELELSSGDLFVYYAVARDARPSDEGRAVSDSYVIEIGKPGAAIAGGFAIPPDEDRFAISLNALIQKTEKLHARRTTMAAAEFSDSTLALAVEQRMVRTEFLFTMGFHGHVEDEEVEAEHSNEIQEGRMENRGQAEITLATRLMTVSERQLTAADTGEALKAMRGALAAIQRALSRHRYFLRTLLTSSEIDLTRRLTGDLSTAKSSHWPARDRTPDERLARVRAVLTDLATLARGLEQLASAGANGDGGDGGDHSSRIAPTALAGLATTTAARVLTLDPASMPMQQASAGLTQVARALGGVSSSSNASADAAARAATGTAAREALTRVRQVADAVLPLAGTAPSASTAAERAPRTTSDPSLRGAFVDALRERRGSR